MSITELGKELRKLRIDHNEKMYDMAQKIGKSSSFISAVETGKKQPPSDFEESIISSYKISEEIANTIRKYANRARSSFTIQANTTLARDTAGLLARRMQDLSEIELKEIITILDSENKEK